MSCGYSSDIPTNIQVHKSTQSGNGEIAPDAANSLEMELTLMMV